MISVRKGRRGHASTTRTIARPGDLSRLRWWEWVDILGGIGAIALAALVATGHVPHPAVIAVLLHVAADFTCQSSETAARKGELGRHLLLHALAAGGFPLAVAGFVAEAPAVTLVWAAVGVISHFAVDWTRKFGIRPVGLGVCLDQACHLAVVLGLTFFLR